MGRGLGGHASASPGHGPGTLCPAALGVGGRTPAAAALWSLISRRRTDGPSESPNQHSRLKYRVHSHVISHAPPARLREPAPGAWSHPGISPGREILASWPSLGTVTHLPVEQGKHERLSARIGPKDREENDRRGTCWRGQGAKARDTGSSKCGQTEGQSQGASPQEVPTFASE